MLVRTRLALGVDKIGRGEKDAAASASVRLKLIFEPIRIANVIRVKHRKIISTALRESPVVGDGGSGIVLAKGSDPTIPVRTNPVPGGVRRSIVDDDELPILEGLAKDAFDSRANVLLRIVSGHADG